MLPRLLRVQPRTPPRLFTPLFCRSLASRATTAEPTPNVRIQGGFKIFKPRTPGLRFVRAPVRDHLHSGRPVPFLTIAKRKTGGRNNTGRITVRHRGGGHKRRIRIIDWLREEPGPQKVVRIEYDPGRSGHIALLKHIQSHRLSYIVAPEGVKAGDVVESFASLAKNSPAAKRKAKAVAATAVADAADVDSTNDNDTTEGSVSAAVTLLTRQLPLNPGNCAPLSHLPAGILLHNIALRPHRAPVIARSAGASAQLLSRNLTHAQLKLASGETRLVPVNCIATIGRVSNPEHRNRKLGKAGANRWRGWRPTVRGAAMNKVDHPMGGGRGKSKGNKHPVSPWGVLSKGGRTRKKGANPLVVKERPRR